MQATQELRELGMDPRDVEHIIQSPRAHSDGQDHTIFGNFDASLLR